jgi:glycosyltransferase involved in cell wall biosynthesis
VGKQTRPTVLHAAQPALGGAARVAADLAADQVHRGWNVAVACPSSGPLRAWAEEVGARHLPWEATRAPTPRSFVEADHLRAIIRAVSPHVVHLHSSKAGLAGRLAIRGRLCTVFQPHAWSFEAVRGPLRNAAILWERFAVRWADVIVCVSEAERERGLRERIGASYQVVPNGVDLDHFSPASPKEQAAARRRLRLGTAPVVVCVGRLSWEKGQDVCVKAWPSVVGRVPGAELILVGEGPERSHLEAQAGPSVRLVGARDDVPLWLAAADVLVAPSRWEGMSLTVLEAMAVGRSVVACDVPGMRELLGEEAGAIVSVEDVDALADALVQRLSDPALARAEGQNGRDRAERSHDFAVTASRIADVYGEALARRRPASPIGRRA